ncbi:hypothetical protein [Desulfocicer vacuolatum]|uniref:hypothetical protein n=1 Tax=Desulfocicer vacuolatum TaxID=2298 RepID=UPI0009FE3127|nr:hypothetical protein [Desulfocicer vacuolatum]
MNLQYHCIETEIKKLYNRRVSMGLKKGLTNELEREIEGLKTALETFDFRRLRSQHRQLAGGKNQWAILNVDHHGIPEIDLPIAKQGK